MHGDRIGWCPQAMPPAIATKQDGVLPSSDASREEVQVFLRVSSVSSPKPQPKPDELSWALSEMAQRSAVQLRQLDERMASVEAGLAELSQAVASQDSNSAGINAKLDQMLQMFSQRVLPTSEPASSAPSEHDTLRQATQRQLTKDLSNDGGRYGNGAVSTDSASPSICEQILGEMARSPEPFGEAARDFESQRAATFAEQITID